MSQPSGNTPLVCGCEEVFYDVRILTYHVGVKPGCLQFWGGTLDSLRAKVKSLRNAWQYAKRKDVLREHYASNPEPRRQKMKEAYSVDPAAKIEKVKKHALEKALEKAGRYGPIFACISCHETNWQSNVVKISDITTINSSYVDLYFVMVSNRELFVKMNFFYLCKTCKKAIDASRMPKRCAKNMLLCPWKDVEDKDFLNMNEAENSLMSPVNLFNTVHFNDDRQRQRVVMVPAMVDSATNPAASIAVPGHRGVRPEVLLSAHEFLAFQCSNSHMIDSRERDRVKFLELAHEMVGQQVQLENQPLYGIDLYARDAVERNRTKLTAVRSVFLPDHGERIENPTNFLKIVYPYAKSAPMFFPYGLGDFDTASRIVPVSESEFVVHYLRYARKELAEFTPFVFHSLYRLETSRATASVHAHHGYSCQVGPAGLIVANPGSKFRLSKLTGSSSYYDKIHKDLQAQCDALGNPDFFYSFTNSNQWDVMIASALSQDGYDVYHKDDEPPCTEEQDTGSPYFAHLPCSSNEGNCHFHSSCHRVSVMDMLPSEEEKQRLADRNIYTSGRIFNTRVRHLIDNVMMSESSGMNVRVHHTIKEFGNLSGWVHCHGVAWGRNGIANSALKKAQMGDILTDDDKTNLISLANSTLSVRDSPQKLVVQFSGLSLHQANDITELARRVQVHVCTPKCEWDDGREGCYFLFPRLPSEFTLICAVPPSPASPEEKEIREYLVNQCLKVKKAVSEAIVHHQDGFGQVANINLLQLLLEALGDIDATPPTQGHYKWRGGVFPASSGNLTDFENWQESMDINFPDRMRHKILFSVYYSALSTSTRVSPRTGNLIHELILKRDVCEANVATYNPYLLEAMRSNMEVTLVLHTPEVVLEYITKSSCTKISDVFKHCDSPTRRQVVNRVAGMREVSEAEAYFRLDPELSLRDSNLKVDWVNTALPAARTGSYKLYDGADSVESVELPGKPGRYVRTSGLIEKYEQRFVAVPISQLITPQQFGMFYRLAKPDVKEQLLANEVNYLDTTKFWVVVHGDHHQIPVSDRPLPSHILLASGGVMVLRDNPICIDKPNPRDEHSRMYADLLMYRAWTSESDYLGEAADSFERCLEMWTAERDNCQSTANELNSMLKNSLLEDNAP